MSVLDFAKRFARAGFYVFPLYNTSQGPQKPYGWALNKPKEDIDQKKIIPATNIESEIDSWPQKVKEGYKSTIHSYGVLGKDIIIFDIDVKDGKNGQVQYEALKKIFNIPSASIIVKSKSGGFHLYFNKPKRFSTVQVKSMANIVLAGKKYEGVDVRGDGGMVIGPTAEGEWEKGTYTLIKGQPGDELSIVPDILAGALLKNASFNDVDSMVMPDEEAKDVMDILKRGEIPPKLAMGQRNEGFFIFIHALKNKGVPRASIRTLCENLKEVTEEAETLNESVNLDDMLNRAFSVDPNNPYDIARDAIEFGMYQLLGYKARLHYIMPNANPYITSKNAHDQTSMATLFSRHTREMVISEKKKKIVNPVDVIIKILPDTHKVDTIGFKPGAGEIYSNSEDSNGLTFLNTYQAPFVPKTDTGLDTAIYEDLCFLVTRIFGPRDTIEYQLGLDFVAWFIQNPEEKCVISPFLLSTNRGVGKSLFFNLLTKIFGVTKTGQKQAQMVKIEDITGRFFNPTGRLLNLLDEVQFPVHKDMRRESTTFWRHLKNLITAETVGVEIKGGDTFQMPNSAGFLMAGNTGSHFPMEEFDRRVWIIDNNAQILERGVIDRLFAIAKGTGISVDERRRLIHSLRYALGKHKIELHLDSMRAPMSEIKREMMLNSMTNEDEWFYTHFENPENLLSATPIVSKSSMIYLIESSHVFNNSRWKEDSEGLFREFKRKGFLKPIRMKGQPGQTRQVRGMYDVNPIGDIITDSSIRDILYTTRNHGSFDELTTDELLMQYNQNLHTIKANKQRLNQARKDQISNSINAPSL